jgi:hypothetical protein
MLEDWRVSVKELGGGAVDVDSVTESPTDCKVSVWKVSASKLDQVRVAVTGGAAGEEGYSLHE